VGVGVIVRRDGRVLLGRRSGAHGADTWALPGGHLEFGETVEHCAAREVLEETGLVIDAVMPGPYTSDVFADEGRHYVTLFVVARSRGYYVLAYSPENTTLDGKYRRITLRAKWAGLDVRARRGYVASPLPPPKALRTK